MSKRVHQEEKIKRSTRISSGVYGKVCAPIFLPDNCYHEPPSYAESRLATQLIKEENPALFFPKIFRCFFTDVDCFVSQPVEFHPRLNPWFGTKDHLVPVRRQARDEMTASGISPPDISRYKPATILSSNIVNNMLGPVPLPVRLNLRLWLKTLNYERGVLADGENMRWIIISLLDHFRLPKSGRYFWSRNQDGHWWEPDMQNILMASCYRIERDFLSLDHKERDNFTCSFRWHY